MSLNEFTVKTEKIKYNRIFLLSDLHLGIRTNSLEWLKNMKDFFYNFYIPYLKKNVQNGDCLFFLGDFFDNRNLLDVNILNAGIDITIDISEILPIYFLTGNHDIYKKHDTDVNSIVAFKYIPNVRVFEKPVIVTNDNSKILILPWIGDKKDEEKYVLANKFDYVFAHTNIKGFRYDNGMRIEKGGADLFKYKKNIKRLFSGHIHKRQEINNFVYIGSPYQIKRSDIGNIKGIYLFDPLKNDYTFTENTFSPIFQRITLDYMLERTLEDTVKLLNNNYTDIIVPEKYIHLFNLTKFIDILKDCNYKKIETKGERIRIDDELSNILDGSNIQDILSLLEKGITELGHKMEVLVKLKLLNRQYYEKATKEELE